jgi:hypothetical protein
MWHVEHVSRIWLQDEARGGAWDGLNLRARLESCMHVAIATMRAVDSSSDGAPLPISARAANIWREVLQPQIRRIVAWSLQAAQDRIEHRPGCFEVYGYDFMVDADLHPWLIEINASPDFSYSTGVTETLVKEASDDVMKVVVDYAAWEAGRSKPSSEPLVDAPSTGSFQCIFRSPIALSRTMTCTAHGIVCTGTGIRNRGAGKVPPRQSAPVLKPQGRLQPAPTENKRSIPPLGGTQQLVLPPKSVITKAAERPHGSSTTGRRVLTRHPSIEPASRSSRVLIPLATAQIVSELPAPAPSKALAVRSNSASTGRRYDALPM